MKRHQTTKYKRRQKKERANRKARQPQTTQQIVQKVYPKAEEEAIVAHGNWVELMKTDPTCELKDIDIWNLDKQDG